MRFITRRIFYALLAALPFCAVHLLHPHFFADASLMVWAFEADYLGFWWVAILLGLIYPWLGWLFSGYTLATLYLAQQVGEMLETPLASAIWLWGALMLIFFNGIAGSYFLYRMATPDAPKS